MNTTEKAIYTIAKHGSVYVAVENDKIIITKAKVPRGYKKNKLTELTPTYYLTHLDSYYGFDGRYIYHYTKVKDVKAKVDKDRLLVSYDGGRYELATTESHSILSKLPLPVKTSERTYKGKTYPVYEWCGSEIRGTHRLLSLLPWVTAEDLTDYVSKYNLEKVSGGYMLTNPQNGEDIMYRSKKDVLAFIRRCGDKINKHRATAMFESLGTTK